MKRGTFDPPDKDESRGLFTVARKYPKRCAGLALFLAVGIAIWYGNQGPNLDARTREFADYLHRGDWGHIYDMAPMKERELQSWKRDQFVTMMRQIDARGRFKADQIEVLPIEGSLRSMKSFTFQLRGQSKVSDPMITISFYRDVDDWRPGIFALPLQMAHATYGDTPTRVKAIFEACRSAKISRLVQLQGPLAMEIDRIPDFLAGRTPWENLFHPFRSEMLTAATGP